MSNSSVWVEGSFVRPEHRLTGKHLMAIGGFHALLLIWSSNGDVARCIQIQEPFQVLLVDAQPCSCKSLYPFWDGIKCSSYVPECDEERFINVCPLEPIEHMQNCCVCAMLRSEPMLIGV